MKHVLLFLLVAFTADASAQTLVTHFDLDTLRTWMTGSFSSKEQSAHDSAYADIHLNTNVIWKHRIDGVWLYAEQALGAKLDAPYRQTVYHLFQINDTTVVNQSYDLLNPARVVGARHNPALFDTLRTDSLKLQVGCAMMLHKKRDGSYRGSTPDKQCATERSGASYVTAEMTVLPDRILNRERGWDMYGKQVWGATKGDYVFIKKNGQ